MLQVNIGSTVNNYPAVRAVREGRPGGRLRHALAELGSLLMNLSIEVLPMALTSLPLAAVLVIVGLVVALGFVLRMLA